MRGRDLRWVVLASIFLLWAGRADAEERPVVRLATLEWVPYVGEELPEQGWLSAVVREAFDRAGYDVELDFLPWTRGMRAALAGTYDGVFPMYDAPQRRQAFVLSAAFPGAWLGLWRRKDGPQLTWRDDDSSALQGLRVGVVQGYINHPLIDADDSGLWLDEARNDALNLAKLGFGRVDVAVADHSLVAHMQAQDPALADLVPVEPAFGVRPTHIGFVRGAARSAALAHTFDLGLAQLTEDGSLARIVERAGLTSAVDLRPLTSAPQAAR